MRSSSSSPSSFEPCSQMSRITSDGRRSSIACSVSSLSLASRVEWPSSSRMPETRSLMSVSSSTTRMSDAMGHFLLLLRGALGWARRDGGARLGHGVRHACLLPVSHRQIDAHRGPFDLSVAFWRIGERKGAPMLLGDPVHDRQAKPGALGAGGHIGLDQTLAILLRQAAAIVDDRDLHVVALGADLGHDGPRAGAGGVGLDRRIYGLAGVLDEIGDGLGEKAPVR